MNKQQAADVLKTLQVQYNTLCFSIFGLAILNKYGLMSDRKFKETLVNMKRELTTQKRRINKLKKIITTL